MHLIGDPEGNAPTLVYDLIANDTSSKARAAASVRHPNVASVFHLGRTDQNYFYAMEFVEGETLDNLIKRNRSDIVIERQTLQGLPTTVNLSRMDAAPLGLQMSLVSGSSERERQKLCVPAKAR